MKILISAGGRIFTNEIKMATEGQWCFELCTKLLERGHEVTVVAPKALFFNSSNKLRVIDLDYKLEEKDGSIAYNWWKFSISSALIVKKILQREKFDVIHHVAPCWINQSFSLVPYIAKQIGKIPFIYGPILAPWPTESLFLRSIAGKSLLLPYITLSSHLFKKTLEKSDKVLLTLKRCLPFVYKFRDKIAFLPYARDLPPLKTSSRLKLDTHKSILYLSRLVKKKGLGLLIKAMREVVKQEPDAKLYIAGKGEHATYFLKQVKELGLDNSVKFLGFVGEEKYTLFRDCDVFCFPSMNEPFGLVLLEAMSCGASIVAFNSGSAPEILDYGFGGILVPPADYKALASAILQLLQDKSLRNRYRRRAKELFEKKFSWPVVIARLESIYQELAN